MRPPALRFWIFPSWSALRDNAAIVEPPRSTPTWALMKHGEARANAFLKIMRGIELTQTKAETSSYEGLRVAAYPAQGGMGAFHRHARRWPPPTAIQDALAASTPAVMLPAPPPSFRKTKLRPSANRSRQLCCPKLNRIAAWTAASPSNVFGQETPEMDTKVVQ